MGKTQDSGPDSPASSTLVELWQQYRATASASEAVYLALRDAITRGVLEPGDLLGEPGIAEILQISRTPIREALLRLEGDRLVERNARRRLVVKGVTPEEILDVYAVRQVLNGLAARLAAENASTNDLIRLRRLHRELRWALEEGDARQMAKLNFEFHDALCAASRNGFLLETLRKAHETQHRYPGSTFAMPERAAESVHEHELMLQAIADRDADRAEELAHRHIAGVREVRIAMLDGTLEEQRRKREAPGSEGREESA